MLPIQKHHAPVGLNVFNQANKSRVWPEKPKLGPYEEFCDWAHLGTNGDAAYELRASLLKEQFHLCAYCGKFVQAVENENGVLLMKAEHYQPKNNKIGNDLNYQNLLAVCLGNQDTKGFRNHCDSAKGEKQLIHIKNPASITQRDIRIIYQIQTKEKAVVVLSANQDVQDELAMILNLNEQRLAQWRFAIWVQKVKIPLKENWTLAKLQQLKAEYSQPQNGKNIAFKDFILWYLDDQIQRRM